MFVILPRDSKQNIDPVNPLLSALLLCEQSYVLLFLLSSPLHWLLTYSVL